MRIYLLNYSYTNFNHLNNIPIEVLLYVYMKTTHPFINILSYVYIS